MMIMYVHMSAVQSGGNRKERHELYPPRSIRIMYGIVIYPVTNDRISLCIRSKHDST